MRKYTFLIAFLFVFGFLLRAQSVESWDFESNNIGDLFDEIGWGATDIEAEVADDPVTSGNKVLKNSIHNYNAAPVLQFVLPAGKTLADYSSFTFKGYFAQGDVGYKDIIVEAYQDSPTAQAFNNTAVKIGSWNRAQMGSSSWEDITIDITNSSTINDTFYIAFGINCAGTGNVGGTGVTTIWYADDVEIAVGTIPVELTSFAAAANGLDVTLTWKTATEVNNSGFEVQRRVSDAEFSAVTFIKGNGTTTQRNEYSFVDKNLAAGKYFYRLKQKDFDGQFKYSNEVEVAVSPVYQYSLEQNYPNPFNPTTTISYTLPEKSMAKLVIFNTIGEEVAVLLNEEQEAGYHKINFNGLNLTSGVYFYKLVAKDFTSVKKLMLVK